MTDRQQQMSGERGIEHVLFQPAQSFVPAGDKPLPEGSGIPYSPFLIVYGGID